MRRKKEMKKILAGYLMLVMILSVVAIPQDVQAADESNQVSVTYNNDVMNGNGLWNVLDGDYGTGYVSEDNPDMTAQYIQFAWNQPVTYNAVILYSTYCGTADEAGQAPTKWIIQTSTDGVSFKDVATSTVEWDAGGDPQGRTTRFEVNGSYKYLRIIVQEANLNWGHYVISEVEFENMGLFDETGSYVIGDYWSAKTKKVPTKDGYVFGGWYKKDGNKFVALNESELSDEVVKNMKAQDAYPKFVPVEVLSVKTQLGKLDSETSLRLLSTVDSKDYQKVGFVYQLGSRTAAEKEMSRVYSAIKLSKSSDEVVYPYEEFDNASKYFIALDVNNISSKSFASIVYARPYWVTMDGTKVMGLARNNRVEDKENNYLSVPVNLLTDGKKPAELAVGKIEITYNTDNYDVVVTGNNKVDFGKVLPEMACSVNEKMGTIKIVGNAVTANENVAAEGIFANIRFVKSSNATSDDLDFTIKTKSFCNWDEKMLDTKNIFIR